MSSRELQERRVERLGPEVRPERLAPIELGVGGLPDQEVRQALLASGPDQQVRVGQARRVQRGTDGGLVDRLSREDLRDLFRYLSELGKPK